MPSGLNNDVPSRGQIDHLLGIVALLAEGLFTNSSAATELLERIRNLSEPGRDLPDALILAQWRQQLSGVIQEVNTAREPNRSGTVAAVSTTFTHPSGPPSAVTGPEAQIEKAVGTTPPSLVALLFVEQLRALTTRFGQQVGDRVMKLAFGELGRLVSDFGTVSRWNGPAFLLVSSFDETRRSTLERKLEDLAANRIELTLDLAGRTIHLKVNFSSHVQPIRYGEPVAAIVRALDDIVASQTRK